MVHTRRSCPLRKWAGLHGLCFAICLARSEELAPEQVTQNAR
jgi:hypothetical protein